MTAHESCYPWPSEELITPLLLPAPLGDPLWLDSKPRGRSVWRIPGSPRSCCCTRVFHQCIPAAHGAQPQAGSCPTAEPRPVPALLSSSWCGFGETLMVTKASLQISSVSEDLHKSLQMCSCLGTQSRNNICDSAAYLQLATFVPPNPKCLLQAQALLIIPLFSTLPVLKNPYLKNFSFKRISVFTTNHWCGCLHKGSGI